MRSPARPSRIRHAVAGAWWALRAYGASTVWIVTVGAVALAAALPLAWLGSPETPRLRLAPPPAGDIGIAFSRLAYGPASAQLGAIATLAKILLGLAVAVASVAVLTILAVAAARAAVRRTETMVRRAVGATCSQLRAGGLVEGLALVGGAAAVGLPGGVVLWRWLVGTWPGTLAPAGSRIALAVGLGLAAIMVLGALLPVLGISRTPRLSRRRAIPHGLVVPVVQFGVSLTILTAAGDLARQTNRTAGGSPAVEHGVGGGTVFELRQTAPLAQRALRYEALLRSLEGEAFGVMSLSSAGVLAGLNPVDFVTTDCGRCAQGTIFTPLRTVPASIGAISPDTFHALGVRVVRGRDMVGSDAWGAPRVAVVNEALAAAHFERGAALGRRVRLGGPERGEWFTVVGVVEEGTRPAVGGAYQPPFAVYVSALQQPPRAAELLIRPPPDGIGVDPATIDRAAVLVRAALGREGAVVGRATEASSQAARLAPLRWFARVARLEGVVVLALATLGMFAVMDLWVTAMLPELAVRRAVGARWRDVTGYLLIRVMGIALGGVACGLWLYQMTSGALAGAFTGLDRPEAALVLRSGALLAAAALAGALFPVWRGARTAPATTLARLES